MNLITLKYCILIGAIVASAGLVAGPLGPQKILTTTAEGEEVSADMIYQFGSDAFYKEVSKPGNEYMQSSLAGYSQDLAVSDSQKITYQNQWDLGIATFKSGYTGCTEAFFELAMVPETQSAADKTASCNKFRAANKNLRQSHAYFTSAKSSTAPTVSTGFTIGLVLPKVDQIARSGQDAEISCMKAILADRDNDSRGFQDELEATGKSVYEMKRVYAELKVLSNDFE
jgi:hypothetical protein